MGFIEDFRRALDSSGLRSAPEIITDGKLHRFGKNKNSWYVLHADFPQAGTFGDWQLQVKKKWCVSLKEKLSFEELAAFRAKVALKHAEQAKLETLERAEAKLRAADFWEDAEAAQPTHPYLVAKGIKPHRLRAIGSALMVPVENEQGEISSIQYIAPDGAKRFMQGGEIKGCFTCIGTPTQLIYICEGFATGASLHEATGNMVAVGFNCNNLAPVAKAIKAKHPAAEIVVCADNDALTVLPSGKRNPGVIDAAKAAVAVGAKLAIPIFHSGHNGTDFNDMRDLDQINLALRQTHLPSDAIVQELTGPLVPISDHEVNALDMSPLPDMSDGKTPRPLSTVENLTEMCKRLRVVCRYNVIKKAEDILIPRLASTLDNKANASISWIKSWCARFGLDTGNVVEFVSAIADRNPYNPVVAWVKSVPWDGVSRLQDLYDTVQERDTSRRALKEVLIRRWLISAIAAAFEPSGVSAHGVLVFQGAQYSGKTAWFKSLVPQALGLTADGVMLKPDDKDSMGQALSFWLIELGELDATFRKADIAQLKAFVTRDKDIIRKPYMPKPSEYARRTVFFASVNDENFLQDPTGNRRFWTIPCDALNYAHKIDMQQLWAEVLGLYEFGEHWALDVEEMAELNSSNEDFQSMDPLEEQLRLAFNWQSLDSFSDNYMSLTDVMKQLGYERPTQGELNRCGNLLRKLNGGKKRKLHGLRQVLVAPPVIGRSNF